MRVDEAGDFFQGVQIVDDLIAHVWPLNLDYDRATIAQISAVDLSERCRRLRFPVEPCEGFRNPHAQLGRNDLLDFFIRKRLDLILQPRERVEVRLRQHIAARGEQLAQLDKGGA